MNMQELYAIEIVDSAPISLVEVIACTHIERARVIEMVEVGLLEPSGSVVDQWRFASRDLRRLRAAQRIVSDLGVNLAGAALVLDLIEERDALLARTAMLPRMIDDD